MTEQAPTDDELMLAVRGGDHEAFTALYSRYRDRLYRFLARYLGDRAAAEDLLQETFLRIYRLRAGYEARGRFSTWLFTIARNLARDYLKAPAQRGRVFASPEAPALDRPDPTSTALEELSRRELQDALARALAGLSEEDRAILLLSRDQGMRYAEIAEILGLSVDAVKVRAHRALLRLRQILGKAS